MPPGRPPRPVNLTGSQAQYVLNYLISSRKVSSDDVSEARMALDREIRNLTDRLASLGDIGGIPSSPRAAAARPAASPSQAAAPDGDGEPQTTKRGGGRRKRRKAKLSAAGRASLQLQGRYLGYLRKIPERQRGRYKKIAATKGREAAVKAMMRAVK